MTKPPEITLSGNFPIRDIAVDSITEYPRMRKLRSEVIADLAQSMKAAGLINPITVRPVQGGGYRLMAGRHRYEAARKLKWKASSATSAKVLVTMTPR